MSQYKTTNRINVRLPSGTLIPTVLSTDGKTELEPKGNGLEGMYANDYADGFQLAPDGVTVYHRSHINLAFVLPRTDVIPVIDCDPDTGEVMSTLVQMDPRLSYLQRIAASPVNRAENGGGTEAPKVANATTEADTAGTLYKDY